MDKLGSIEDMVSTWDQLFGNATNTTKVEMFQDYTAIDDGPSLQAWRRGEKETALQLARADPEIVRWTALCKSSQTPITRIRLVTEPRTTYTDWEIEVCFKGIYVPNKIEHILLVPTVSTAEMDLPQGDFWIFDSSDGHKTVLQLRYNQASAYAGAEVWHENDGITHYLNIRDRLLTLANVCS